MPLPARSRSHRFFVQVGLALAISFTVIACLSRWSQIYEKVAYDPLKCLQMAIMRNRLNCTV